MHFCRALLTPSITCIVRPINNNHQPPSVLLVEKIVPLSRLHHVG
jgi:hypothetical protein